MTTLTLKRKKQVFTVSGGKVDDPSLKPEQPVLKPDKKTKDKKTDQTKQPKPDKPEALQRFDLIPRLVEAWPDLFTNSDSDIKPLKVGILRELMKEKQESQRCVKKGIPAYVTRPAYWQKIIDGDFRYDQKGSQSGKISNRQKEQAREKLDKYLLQQNQPTE